LAARSEPSAENHATLCRGSEKLPRILTRELERSEIFAQ
jgi:hypothetical protein